MVWCDDVCMYVCNHDNDSVNNDNSCDVIRLTKNIKLIQFLFYTNLCGTTNWMGENHLHLIYHLLFFFYLINITTNYIKIFIEYINKF